MTPTDVPTPRWLFVRTCQDLVSKQRSTAYYEKLRMAGLLRHLLVGPRSLLSGARAEKPDVTLEFWYRVPPDGDAWDGPKGFDASRREIAPGEVAKTGLDAFLGARVARFGDWYSVQQLIETVAHAYGGQYALVPDGVSDTAMHALAESAGEGAGGRLAHTLHNITGVVLRGLLPLADPRDPTDLAKAPRKARANGTHAATGKCPFTGQG